MKLRYEKPPYQPRWILRLQVWLLRRRLLPAFNRQCLVITTTGRTSGRPHAVPIGFVRDGATYLAMNVGARSNWYRNALANPCVTLEVDGKAFEARAASVPVNKPEQLQQVLDVYRRERPGTIEGFLGIALDTPLEDLMDIGQYVGFLRFSPVA